jgi:renalase
MPQMTPEIFDVAIIGAGIAGLACAQALTQAGQNVILLDKSRGVGGRVATRRLHATHADHGTCYLSPANDPEFQHLIQDLLTAGILQIWTDTVYEFSTDHGLQPGRDRHPRYIAPAGMSAIAKFLTPHLNLRLNHLVTALTLQSDHWECAIANELPVCAKAIALAIPAPQAMALVKSQPDPSAEFAVFLEQLTAVEFLPSLSVMAGYGSDLAVHWQSTYPQVQAITFLDDPVLGWLGLDSSKRTAPVDSVFVLQSSAAFATTHLDSPDLQPAAQQMLAQAAQYFDPELAAPDWMQIHRWRYAFARSPLPAPYLIAPTALPLVCAGDWCGGRKVEDAYRSGTAIARHLLGL